MPQSYHQARFPSAARSLQRKDGLLGSDLGRNWFHDDKQIYQVSGLSPTPSLVEHAPSTEGSPESYISPNCCCMLGSQKSGNRQEKGKWFKNRPGEHSTFSHQIVQIFTCNFCGVVVPRPKLLQCFFVFCYSCHF